MWCYLYFFASDVAIGCGAEGKKTPYALTQRRGQQVEMETLS